MLTTLQVIRAARSYPSRREAAEVLAQRFGGVYAHLSPYGGVLYTHALLNWSQQNQPKNIIKNMEANFLIHFQAYTTDFSDKDKIFFFNYLLAVAGFGLTKITNFQRLLPTLNHIKGLSNVRPALNALKEMYGTLELYRGVSAINERQAEERMRRMFWGSSYQDAIHLYCKSWLRLHRGDRAYVAVANVNVEHALFFMFSPDESNRYGFAEFVVHPEKIEITAMSEISPD